MEKLCPDLLLQLKELKQVNDNYRDWLNLVESIPGHPSLDERLKKTYEQVCALSLELGEILK